MNENFPNPRNWECLSNLIKNIPESNPVFETLAISRLGPAVAKEFFIFMHLDVPWEDWLDENSSPRLPAEFDRKCYLISILANTPERAEGLCRLTSAFQKNGYTELAFLSFHLLRNLLPVEELTKLKHWNELVTMWSKYLVV
ncbi:MAG: hypothetical protein N3A65_05160 [candidate division WOR-3 bacterium]|nr:hypothetical protein [candidate division WOR-3 bacterium]